MSFISFGEPQTVISDARGIYHPSITTINGGRHLFYTYGDTPPPWSPTPFSLKIGVAVEEVKDDPAGYVKSETPLLSPIEDVERADYLYCQSPQVLDLGDRLLMIYDGYSARGDVPNLPSGILTATAKHDEVLEPWTRRGFLMRALEEKHEVWVERAFLYKEEDLYYLLYTSFGDTASPLGGWRHHISLAVGTDLLNPNFTRVVEEPILKGRKYDVDPSTYWGNLFDWESTRQPRIFPLKGCLGLFYGGNTVTPPQTEVYKTGLALGWEPSTWGRPITNLELPEDVGQGAWLEWIQDKPYLYYSTRDTIDVVEVTL